MLAFPLVGSVVVAEGWRIAWAGIGWCLLPGLALVGWLLARRGPEECGLTLENDYTPDAKVAERVSFTWSEALRTPAFWVFAVASSVYNLVASGIGLAHIVCPYEANAATVSGDATNAGVAAD